MCNEQCTKTLSTNKLRLATNIAMGPKYEETQTTKYEDTQVLDRKSIMQETDKAQVSTSNLKKYLRGHTRPIRTTQGHK